MNTAHFDITTYVHFKDGKISLDGELLFSSSETELPEILKDIYKNLDTDYRKFFKMDTLSKAAFLPADVLLKSQNLASEENSIAVVLSNNASSLDTDRKHQESIAEADNFYPSPAVFVYTLPNICIGEISIKHRLFSENSFFIFETFNARHLQLYAKQLLNTKKADKVLCGWVNVDADKYESFLYLVTQTNEKGNHTTAEINRLYNDQL
ncbi:MAG: 3-oxoacyl-ACP synthase [Patiriisocius sp.]|uniref:3-oxoacyl-ACP synthase n=1 Tax=Patiriisocius sp. TaxID=2822396 RepID=UPI003EF2463F